MIKTLDSFSAEFNAAERRRSGRNGSDLLWAQENAEDTMTGGESFTHSSGSFATGANRDNHDVYHSVAADVRRSQEKKTQPTEASIWTTVKNEPIFQSAFSQRETEPTLSEYLKDEKIRAYTNSAGGNERTEG